MVNDKNKRNCDRFDNPYDAKETWKREYKDSKRAIELGLDTDLFEKWLFEMISNSSKLTEDEFKRKNNFRKYTERHCCNCKHFIWSTAEAVEEERSRRRAGQEPLPIDSCDQTDPPFKVLSGNVCDAWEYRRVCED